MIRELQESDLKNGFFETLSSLSPLASKFIENYSKALLLFKERQENKIKTFVFLEDKKVVGTVSYFVERKFSGGNCCHIEDLSVHRDYKRKGIGKKLIEHIKESNKDCYKIVLSCNDHLISFYEQLGFKALQNSMFIYQV